MRYKFAIVLTILVAAFASGVGGGFFDDTKAEAAISSFEGGNGTAGLPTCNAYTFNMVAYNVWGRGYLCAIGPYGFTWIRIN